jgi:hypothetical protein
MTHSEIARSYRQAEDKATQIEILAQPNSVEVKTIKKILTDAGEVMPEKPKKYAKPRKAKKPRKEYVQEFCIFDENRICNQYCMNFKVYMDKKARAI